MIKYIFLHIGLHKTGSSSIQKSLAGSAGFLERIGYLYPVFRTGRHKIINHSMPFFSLFTDNPLKYHENILNGITTDKGIKKLHK